MSVCQHRRCKNSSVEICPTRSGSGMEKVGWIHFLLLTDCNSQHLDITTEYAKVTLLNPGLLLDETTHELKFKKNLKEIWRKAQFGEAGLSTVHTVQHNLESANPHLNHEMGCQLAPWAEHPQAHGPAQQLVPCSRIGNHLLGTSLRCDKVQSNTKIIQRTEKMCCSRRLRRAWSIKLVKSEVVRWFAYAGWRIFIEIK